MKNFQLPRDANGSPIPITGLGRVINLDGSAPESDQSEVLDSENDVIVQTSAVTECWVKVGVNPVASATDSTHYAESQPDGFFVKKGERIACYGGKLNITIAKTL